MASIFDTLNPNQSNTMGLLGVQSPLQIPQAQERFAQMQQMQQLNNLQQPQQRPELSRTQGIGLMLSALSDALGGRDVASRSLERQQFLQSQVEADRDRQSQLETQQALSKYLSPEEMALYAAGVSFKDIKEFTTEDLSGQQMIEKTDESVETFTKDTNLQDDYANIDQAFGPVDALQETFINAPFRFLFGTDLAPETAAAIRDRDNLNLEILATLANDYTGKPNMLLLGEIKKNIPEISATSETDAFQKYSNFQIQTESRIKNLEDGIKSRNISDSDKEKYREELFKSKILLKKLQAATLALKGESKNILKPDLNSGSVDFSNLYLE